LIAGVLVHVLEAAGGSRTRAAEILGVDRRTLYRGRAVRGYLKDS
jgi:DNA-binding protein Fis